MIFNKEQKQKSNKSTYFFNTKSSSQDSSRDSMLLCLLMIRQFDASILLFKSIFSKKIFLKKLFLIKTDIQILIQNGNRILTMILAKFLLITKSRRSIQTRIIGIRHKNQFVLFAGKLIVSPYHTKISPTMKIFLEEDKKWETFGSYEKLPWIKIDRI